MIDRDFWVGDSLPAGDWEQPAMEEGRFWSSTAGDATLPDVTRPIGFMRRKLRVRVKAWCMPILPDEGK
jgi:hypothetical protein